MTPQEKQAKDMKYLGVLKESRLAILLLTYDWGCRTCKSCIKVKEQLTVEEDSDKYSNDEILYLYSLYAPSADWPMWRNKKANEKA